MIKQYLFEKRKVNTISKHPLLQKFKTEPDAYFVQNTKKIGVANIPIITSGGQLISNPIDFDAVVKNSEEEMMFRLEPDLNDQNVLEALLHTTTYLNLCDDDRFLLVDEVSAALQNNLDWAKKLPGDINEKLSILFGCHKETVKYIKRQKAEVEKAITDEQSTTGNLESKNQDTKGFKFSTDKQSLMYGGVKFKIKGKPSISDDMTVYRFISEESEIKISIKSIKPSTETTQG